MASERDIVYITYRREVYHTNRDCIHLDRPNTIHEVALDELDQEIALCKRCSGESSPSGGDGGELARKLEAMDPDEVG